MVHTFVEAVPASVRSIHVWQKTLALLVVTFEVETATCGAVYLAWGLSRDRAVELKRPPTHGRHQAPSSHSSQALVS